jgi:hypothetical protein
MALSGEPISLKGRIMLPDIAPATPLAPPPANAYRRFSRFILLGILVFLAAIAARPYLVDRLFSATTPRPIEARGNLADYERSAIEIFARASPSVVQVAGEIGSEGVKTSGDDGSGEVGVQTGTGFILGPRWSHCDEQSRRSGHEFAGSATGIR